MSSIDGCVYLVGAGPGDPGLITLRGVQCLQRADLVLYDYLVDRRVLRHASTGAECVCLGRHGVGRIMSQEEINRRMIEAARQGRTVVRLKGGDPMIFARAAEELQALKDAGIPYQIVPGVSAALAVGSYAGIPLTHRETASCVAFVTGQETPHKSGQAINYGHLASFPGTLVFYMGVTTAPTWSQSLIKHGMDGKTPVAIVRHCSDPQQRIWRCTLQDVAQTIAREQIRPPSLIVVGQVAASDEYGWFSELPLFGQTVLVTRPVHQAAGMEQALAEVGARVLLQPAIAIGPPSDWHAVDQAIGRLDDFDWIVFSSANGVAFFLDRLLQTGRDRRAVGRASLAAIGPATAEELRERGLLTDVTPAEFRAEQLAEALAQDANSKQFLLIRASRGREVLAEALAAAGGAVTQIVVYESKDVTAPDPEVLEELQAANIDWVTATSSAIARSLVSMFGDLLHQTRLAAISPLTAGTLEELGHSAAVVAEEYTAEGVIAAIRQSSRP